MKHLGLQFPPFWEGRDGGCVGLVVTAWKVIGKFRIVVKLYLTQETLAKAHESEEK